ncbi:hypothetical protein P9112_000655 [Eukaryota sp. TZLM1-RC]
MSKLSSWILGFLFCLFALSQCQRTTPATCHSWRGVVTFDTPFIGKSSSIYYHDGKFNRARVESRHVDSDIIQIHQFYDSTTLYITPYRDHYLCDKHVTNIPPFPAAVDTNAQFVCDTVVNYIQVEHWKLESENHSYSWFIHRRSLQCDQVVRVILHSNAGNIVYDVTGVEETFHFDDPLFNGLSFGCPLEPIQKFTISGMIRDSNTSSPIANSTIRLVGKEGEFSSFTGNNGIYTIPSVPKGDYYLFMDHHDYYTNSKSLHVYADIGPGGNGDFRAEKKRGDWLIVFSKGSRLAETNVNLFLNLYNRCLLYYGTCAYRCRVDDTMGNYATSDHNSRQSITVVNHHSQKSTLYVKKFNTGGEPLIGADGLVKIYNDEKLVHSLKIPTKGSVVDTIWKLGVIDGYDFILENELGRD